MRASERGESENWRIGRKEGEPVNPILRNPKPEPEQRRASVPKRPNETIVHPPEILIEHNKRQTPRTSTSASTTNGSLSTTTIEIMNTINDDDGKHYSASYASSIPRKYSSSAAAYDDDYGTSPVLVLGGVSLYTTSLSCGEQRRERRKVRSTRC